MCNVNLKDKHIHKYISDLIYIPTYMHIYIYIKREREREKEKQYANKIFLKKRLDYLFSQ
jgi:hypothetical protein